MPSDERRHLGVMCGAIFAASLLVWSVACWLSFDGIHHPDAVDYAQIARESLEGEGSRSLQSFPYVLAWLDEHGHATAPPWPNVTRFPLPVALRAASFAIFGVSDLAAVLPGGVFLAATAVVLFLLGRRHGDPVVGWLAAGLYVIHATTLDYALSGLTEVVAGFFVSLIALWLAIAGDRDRPFWAPVLVLGVIIGFAAMQRSNLVLAAPIVGGLLLMGPERRGWRAVGILGLGVFAGMSPWIFHDLLEFGRPLVQLTSDRGLLRPVINADPFYDFRQYEIWPLVFAHLGRFTTAMTPSWLAVNWREFFGTGFAWIGPLCLLGALGPVAKPVRSTWLFATAGVFATFLLLSGMYPTVMRFFFPWTPLCLLLAVGGVVGWARRAARNSPIAVPAAAVAALVVAVGLLAFDFGTAQRTRGEMPGRAFAAFISSHVEPGGVVASDRSSRVAWRSMRPSVRFYWDPEKLDVLEREYFEVAAIALWRPGTIGRFREAFADSPLRDRFVELTDAPGGHALWLRVATPRTKADASKTLE